MAKDERSPVVTAPFRTLKHRRGEVGGLGHFFKKETNPQFALLKV